jgi:adenylylsulfate kinase-like enzyme
VRLSETACGAGRAARLEVDEEEEEIGGGEDVVEPVPLQLGEEHFDRQRVAKVVQEAGRQLEDADVELKVAAVAPHDHERR